MFSTNKVQKANLPVFIPLPGFMRYSVQTKKKHAAILTQQVKVELNSKQTSLLTILQSADYLLK